MKKTSPAAIANQNFAVHYEQLRCDALGTTGDHSIGLALFLRNGIRPPLSAPRRQSFWRA